MDRAHSEQGLNPSTSAIASVAGSKPMSSTSIVPNTGRLIVRPPDAAVCDSPAPKRAAAVAAISVPIASEYPIHTRPPKTVVGTDRGSSPRASIVSKKKARPSESNQTSCCSMVRSGYSVASSSRNSFSAAQWGHPSPQKR